MRPLLSRALILLAVFGLVFTPPVLTGYRSIPQADSALKVNDISRAAGLYERAARFLPWVDGLWEQAGQLRFKLGETSQAITLLEKSRQTGSLSGSGWDILGISYWKQTGDLDQALEIWKAGLALYPTYSTLDARLAIVYFEQGDYNAERDALERWVAGDGLRDAHAHYRLGQLLAPSEPGRALQAFKRASELDTEYNAAVETMQTALNLASVEKDKSSQLVITGRGLGLIGEWSLAADTFRQAVAADGANAEAWAWLGEAEQQLGRDGRVELDKALFLDRTNPIVRSLRGVYWIRQGRGDQALAEYLLAAEYDPENPAWHISIGEAYAMRGDVQAGLTAYFRAVEMDPADADIWLALASFSTRYNLQVEDVGLPAAQKAVDLRPEDPLALDAVGWASTLLERYEDAQEALEQALELDPQFAQAHLHLGIVAIQIDEWEAARQHLLQARDLDPVGPIGEQAQLLLNQYFP